MENESLPLPGNTGRSSQPPATPVRTRHRFSRFLGTRDIFVLQLGEDVPLGVPWRGTQGCQSHRSLLPPHPAQVGEAEAAGLARAHVASWLRAMRGPVEGQEPKGPWLATKSCKNQPLTCFQTLPSPTAAPSASASWDPPNQTASGVTGLKKYPSPPSGQTHTSQVTRSLGTWRGRGLRGSRRSEQAKP